MDGLETAWYRVGIRPVKTIAHDDGSFGVYAFNWDTGAIELNMDYLRHVTEGADNLDEISEQQFEYEVAQLCEERGLPG